MCVCLNPISSNKFLHEIFTGRIIRFRTVRVGIKNSSFPHFTLMVYVCSRESQTQPNERSGVIPSVKVGFVMHGHYVTGAGFKDVCFCEYGEHTSTILMIDSLIFILQIIGKEKVNWPRYNPAMRHIRSSVQPPGGVRWPA